MMNSRLTCALIVCLGIVVGCSKDEIPEEPEFPYLTIQGGTFDVDTVPQQSNFLGSGSISFNYSGDAVGTFSVSGTLTESQSDSSGVGAIMEKRLDEDQGTFVEGFSIMGFHPTSGGKANIFILGTKAFDFLVESIEPGSYPIGQFAPFTGVFFVGLEIDTFWKGETDLSEAAEQAFQLAQGTVQITKRDSTHVTGTFFGQTAGDSTATLKLLPLE